VQTLRSLAASDLPIEEVGDLARQIYRRLNDFLKDWQAENPGNDPEWIPALRAEALLWTTKREWWQNEEDVLVADDPTLQQLFEPARASPSSTFRRQSGRALRGSWRRRRSGNIGAVRGGGAPARLGTEGCT